MTGMTDVGHDEVYMDRELVSQMIVQMLLD